MKQHVATFRSAGERVTLGFGSGKFDEWCIYVLSSNKRWMKFPTDEWYFEIVKSWTKFRSSEDIYADFVRVYDMTTGESDYYATKPVVDAIKDMAGSYEDRFEAAVIFTILYMGMIAEENKDGAILKKRIKRLGMHQILVDGVSPKIAAHFSRGKPVTELVIECHTRGF